jgi:hypothetical protein
MGVRREDAGLVEKLGHVTGILEEPDLLLAVPVVAAVAGLLGVSELAPTVLAGALWSFTGGSRRQNFSSPW